MSNSNNGSRGSFYKKVERACQKNNVSELVVKRFIEVSQMLNGEKHERY